VTVSAAPPIEGTGIASQETVAEAREAKGVARPKENVSVLWGAVGYVQRVA